MHERRAAKISLLARHHRPLRKTGQFALLHAPWLAALAHLQEKHVALAVHLLLTWLSQSLRRTNSSKVQTRPGVEHYFLPLCTNWSDDLPPRAIRYYKHRKSRLGLGFCDALFPVGICALQCYESMARLWGISKASSSLCPLLVHSPLSNSS